MNLVHEGVLDPNEPDLRDEKREAEEARRGRETVTEIASEMIECAEAADPAIWGDPRIAGLVRKEKAQQIEYANRIKAAWKRQMSQSWHHREMEELILRHEKEVAELKNQTGNAAAMRNAMMKIHDKVNGLDEECGVDPVEIRDLARAALSAPARNCDRFADELDTQLAFLNDVWLISVDRETMLDRDKYENWTDEMRTRYGRWLLAPAAERKGETKNERH